MNEQNMLQEQKPTNIWVVTSIVITALIVGGVVYALQSSRLKSSEQSFQQQITLLQNQIDQLQQANQNQNQQATQPSTSQNNQPFVNQNENNNQQVNQPQEIVYSNSKYQFSLKLPVAWEGYKVTEPGNGGTICFSIPSSGSQPFCIFQLYILSENESLPSALKLVGQTNGWKVASDKNTSCVQFNDFQCERSKEVSEILKTFKVIQ